MGKDGGIGGGDGRGTELEEIVEGFEVVLSSSCAVAGMKRRGGQRGESVIFSPLPPYLTRVTATRLQIAASRLAS